jgi:hypothetical protein
VNALLNFAMFGLKPSLSAEHFNQTVQMIFCFKDWIMTIKMYIIPCKGISFLGTYGLR